MRTSDITVDDGEVYLRLGTDRVLIPDRLGELVHHMPRPRQTGPAAPFPPPASGCFPDATPAGPSIPTICAAGWAR